MPMWYRFNSSGPLVEEHTLRQACRAPGVHEDDRVLLFRLIGFHRAAGVDEVLVPQVVGHVAVTDQHDVAERQLVAHIGDVAGEMFREHRVDEHDLAPGVGQDELQLLASQAQVERVDDAGAEETGVVQLEVLVAVGRHHREAVASADPELGAHRIRQTQDAVAVLGEGGVVVTVVEPDFGAPAIHRRQEASMEHEFLHDVDRLPRIISREGAFASTAGLSFRGVVSETTEGAVMDRMNPLDASFLYLENGTTHMHIGSCAVFEGPPPAYDDLVALFVAKLPLVPRYRQRVRFVPMDLGRPVWVDDPHFNLEYHVRHSALPAPAARRTCAGSWAA